jgi:hypothetical protein
MPNRQPAIINVSKGLQNAPLAAIAAIGKATRNVWSTDTNAIPAALTTSSTLKPLLEKKQDEHLELPIPIWWTQEPQSWQAACSSVEIHLPEIITGVEEQLRKETSYPSSSRIKQIFAEQVAQHLSSWEVQPQDRYMVAGYITPPLLEKSAVVLKPVIGATGEDAIAKWQATVADTLDTIQKSTTSAPTIPLPTAGNLAGGSTTPSADTIQDSQVISLLLEQKRQNGEYDVYVCYDEADEAEVRDIGDKLKAYGILPWLDVLVRPGKLEKRIQDQQIQKIPSATVFVGQHKIVDRQELQMYSFIEDFLHRGIPVIPVILASAPKDLRLPPYLGNFGRVDFRRSVPEPMGQLIWGIKGVRP